MSHSKHLFQGTTADKRASSPLVNALAELLTKDAKPMLSNNNETTSCALNPVDVLVSPQEHRTETEEPASPNYAGEVEALLDELDYLNDQYAAEIEQLHEDCKEDCQAIANQFADLLGQLSEGAIDEDLRDTAEWRVSECGVDVQDDQ